MPNPTIPKGRWSASMRHPPRCWPMLGRPSRRHPDTPGARTTSTGGRATRNLFLASEPLAGWRHVEVTERRTKEDFAHQMRWLVDEAYPDVAVVRVVLDNLNTHRKASLYEAFPVDEAGALPSGWSSTTRPSTAVGSIWRRSSSASSPAVASGSVSRMRNPLPGGPRPGTGAKRSSSPHQLALQHPGRQNQTPSPLSHQFLT